MSTNNRTWYRGFRPSLLLTALALVLGCSNAGSQRNAVELIQNLETLSGIESDSLRMQKADQIWAELKETNQIPFRQDSTVVFLYRGKAESVSWNGDFNGWSGNRQFPNEGTRINGTNIWYLQSTFPPNARLDYKITLNGEEWILDPDNPHRQWSGFGPNSELRMPQWKPDPITERNPEADRGSFSGNKLIESEHMGYEIQYRVYTPAGYDTLGPMPVLYVTDGHEYSNDRLGSLIIVLDNLLHESKIKPLMAVFVDPRNPNNTEENPRADQFALNEDYLSFFEEELIPEIQADYKVIASPKARAILGTSLGGLNAAYFGFSSPHIFRKIAIQAPAFGYRDHIYDIVKNSRAKPSELFMSVGLLGDDVRGARRMKEIFEEKEYELTYIEVNEGHSWGAWRSQMDEILVQFFGK